MPRLNKIDYPSLIDQGITKYNQNTNLKIKKFVYKQNIPIVHCTKL
jgi:hypothetical protein